MITERPLAALTLIALVPRLMAAVFSGGYFAHDDHFLIIEAAASWVDGFDYNNWLPWNQGADPRPSGHSFFYVGLHYLLFSGLKVIGLTDPKTQMVVIRSLHALWSLLIVRLGYRIALRLGDPQIAWRTGLFLALFCFMPFLSVRNLVEVVCIPFLMLAAWQLIRNSEGPTVRDAVIAGVWIGLAMNVRFQTLFFAAGMGLAFLLQQRWRGALAFTGGLLLPLAMIQGGTDLFIWGRPFAELSEYVGYNLIHTTTYFDQPWYNYLLLLAGLFIPPFSIAIFLGFFRRPSPLLIWLPVLVFLAVHSYIPNKQERFLLPIVPLFFILGYVSWEQWRTTSAWWMVHARSWRGILAFTWTLNTVLLIVLCVSYSKRSRVEAMVAVGKAGTVQGIVLEDTYEGEPWQPPLFYLGNWQAKVLPWGDPEADLAEMLSRYEEGDTPNYILFIGEEDLKTRMDRVEAQVGPLTVIGKAEPGLVDRVVHWLNPVNRNETTVITRLDR